MSNPAGRLRYWLEERPDAALNSQAVIHAWQVILGYEKDSWQGTTQVLRHASMLAELCVETRNEVYRLPEVMAPEILLRDFDQVEGAVSFFTGMTQHTLASQVSTIQETGHRCLELLDTYLNAHRPQRTLSKATLSDLAERVDALLAELGEHPDLDVDTRDFIRVRFEEVLQALSDASVVGPRAVERSVEALLGSIQRQPTRWQRVGESTLANVIGGIIVALLMSIGQEPTHDMLPPGTPSQVLLVETDLTVNANVEHTDAESNDEGVVDAEIVGDTDQDEGREP